MQKTQPKYKAAEIMIQLCGLLNVSVENVLRRARMPVDFLDNENRVVTSEEYFRGWNAIIAEADREDLPIFLGQAYARGPFNPAFFAFSCSATVGAGLERLALFKPIVGPFLMGLRNTATGLQITKSANPPNQKLPLTFSATEMVFLIEAIRNATAQPVVPVSVTLPSELPCHAEVEAFLGTQITIGEPPQMTLSHQDAALPLLSRNPAQWAVMEPEYKRQLAEVTEDLDMATRLHNVLLQLLPSGKSNVTEAAQQLRLSTRSLQRHLARDGQSFQAVLDDTRCDLAKHYLQNTSMNVEEISYLLAYRDPNSFYRAFHLWTGMTPKQARGALIGRPELAKAER